MDSQKALLSLRAASLVSSAEPPVKDRDGVGSGDGLASQLLKNTKKKLGLIIS